MVLCEGSVASPASSLRIVGVLSDHPIMDSAYANVGISMKPSELMMRKSENPLSYGEVPHTNATTAPTQTRKHRFSCHSESPHLFLRKPENYHSLASLESYTRSHAAENQRCLQTLDLLPLA